jgi:uncharacterized protein (TIGR01777 family)
MRILITGATGFVGTALSKSLLEQGHELTILTRNRDKVAAIYKNSKVNVYEWKNTLMAPPEECITGINGVINLMGENIAASRWSEGQKKVLHDSRVNATVALTTLLNLKLESPLDFFIQASAVGVYPANLVETLTEDSPLAGNNFLANLCKEWEGAVLTLKKVKRVVIVRTAVVLEKNGGALKKMLPPFKMGVGGPIGNGQQLVSWIHLDDLVKIYITAATDERFSGIYNGCAPYPVSNLEFTRALGGALHRPTIFPVPDLMLKLMFGEMASVILDSQKITSKRLPEHHFIFQYEKIESAFNKIFEKEKMQ